MFELFNEPFMNVDFTGDQWQYIMFGTGGAFSGYPATSTKGNQQNIATPWTIASYQAMINAVRATGATNPVLIGSLSYTADLSGWLSHVPTDPLNQMAATWHPYPTYGAAFGTPASAQPDFAPQVFTEVQAIFAAGIPVIATETGDQDSAGTVGAPLVATITAFADKMGMSLLGWTWDVWTNPDDVLIKDVNGTPTDGYGQFFHNWMVNHP
jgi:endoglucanase